MGRASQGVRGISLRDGDRVVAMVVVKREGTLLAISENGFGKRTLISSYSTTHRGSKGVITLKTTDRNGYLISLLEVVDNDDLMIVTKEGMIIRQAVDRITVIGRNTQGVKLIELKEGDKVYDITRIIAEEATDDEDDTQDAGDIPEEVVKEDTDEVPENTDDQPADEFDFVKSDEDKTGE